jgi:hypothetical protein
MTNTDSNSQRAPRMSCPQRRRAGLPKSGKTSRGSQQQAAFQTLNRHQYQKPDEQTGAWMHSSFRPFVSRER